MARRDGVCYVLTDSGEEIEWNLFGSTILSRGQVSISFKPWAAREGLPADPMAAAAELRARRDGT